MWIFLPAAGNRNGTNLNNQGSNGNYWSSSLNTDNPYNGRNLNFNSSNKNMNNNNRYNGHSVRAVLSTYCLEWLPGRSLEVKKACILLLFSTYI